MILLFDLDGTLIDSTEAILESFHTACKKLHFPSPKDEQIKKLIGYPLDYMFLHVGVPKEKVWDFVAAYKEHYRKISKQKTVLLPHAKEAVKSASTFARLGIVTTKTARYSRELMEHFGLMDYFEVLVGREDVKHPKPHPEPILRALSCMQPKQGESVWMIGDTKLDFEAALEAGINAVGVLCGYGTKEELKQYGFPLKKDALEAVLYIQKSMKEKN